MSDLLSPSFFATSGSTGVAPAAVGAGVAPTAGAGVAPTAGSACSRSFSISLSNSLEYFSTRAC